MLVVMGLPVAIFDVGEAVGVAIVAVAVAIGVIVCVGACCA